MMTNKAAGCIRFITLLIFSALTASLICACQPEKKAGGKTGEITTGFFAMDTYMNLRAYDAASEDLAALEEETLRLEKMLSVTDPESEIHKLDANGLAEVSDETAELIKTALAYCEKSGGCFDISIYPIVREWGFTTGEYHVPKAEVLDQLLECVNFRELSLEENSAALKPGMEIDLGGITKGYLGDRLTEILKERGVSSAILDLGGNIVTIGKKPGNMPWKVGIRNPKGEEYLGYLEVSDCSVITSGGYERWFEDDNGNVWWHILDPFTGYSAKNGLISVTVVGENGAYCDAMSTALFVMGKEKAPKFWKEYRDFEAVFVTDTNEILVTEGLEEAFTFNDSNEKTYSVQIIR